MLYRQFCYPTAHLIQFINELFFGLFMVLHGGLLLTRSYACAGWAGCLVHYFEKLINTHAPVGHNEQ